MPLHKVDDGAIKQRALTLAGDQREFYHAETDATIDAVIGEAATG
jgi:poly-gamma-glutamate capsule biosynthesis protein CapA/YwtB (metallophosphatase superfamily)